MAMTSQTHTGNGGLSRLEGKWEERLITFSVHYVTGPGFVLVPSDGMSREEAKGWKDIDSLLLLVAEYSKLRVRRNQTERTISLKAGMFSGKV